MSQDLSAEHRDAAALAVQAGQALLELRAAPPAITWRTTFSSPN